MFSNFVAYFIIDYLTDSMIRFITFCILFLSSLFVFAQDNQRYLAVSLVNDDEEVTHGLDQIDAGGNIGMNAVIISIRWDVINRLKKNETNPWQHYDNQIARALAYKMKVALRIVMCPICPSATVGDPDNQFVETCDGWSAKERMMGFLTNTGDERVYQQAGNGFQKVNTSYAAQNTLDRIEVFSKQVMERYKYLLDKNNLLYVSLAVTAEQEMGYPFVTNKGFNGGGEALFDYSSPMIISYRKWLKTKYKSGLNLEKAWGKDYKSDFFYFRETQPKRPTTTLFNSAFTGNAGKDWYTFRTLVLKNLTDSFAKTLKDIDKRIKVINDFGAVTDWRATQRGSFSFKAIGENIDGVKSNDGPTADHRFVMDLLRSTLEGKLIMSEIGYENNIQLVKSQADEAFSHGANLVSVFQFQEIIKQGYLGVIQDITNKYIKNNNGTIPIIKPAATLKIKTSELLSDGGCSTDRSNVNGDCKAYTSWKNLYKNAPVNLVLEDDLIIDTTTYTYVPEPPLYKGYVDTVTCSIIKGWALNENNLDDILSIDILIDSKKVGTVKANTGNYKGLVKLYGDAAANKEYTFQIPENAVYKDGQAHRVTALVSGTSTLLIDAGNELKYLNCKAATPPVKLPEYKGALEVANCDTIRGWTLNVSDLKDELFVDIFSETEKIATIKANTGNRADLAKTYGIQAASKEFLFLLPKSAAYKDGKKRRITAKVGNTAFMIPEKGDSKFITCTSSVSTNPQVNTTVVPSTQEEIKLISEATEGLFLITPNPTQGIALLKLYAKIGGKSILTIHDLLGREVYSRDIEFMYGNNVYLLDITDLPTGNYIISTSIADKYIAGRLMKN
jgi:hypothetical protein